MENETEVQTHRSAEPTLMSETQTLEKMVDDIANKLQMSADDIITIHVSDVSD